MKKPGSGLSAFLIPEKDDASRTEHLESALRTHGILGKEVEESELSSVDLSEGLARIASALEDIVDRLDDILERLPL